MNIKFESPIKATLHAIVFDSAEPESLAIFYAKLFGSRAVVETYGAYTVDVPSLGINLAFQLDEHFKRPVWLGLKSDQQAMIHLDILVENRLQAVKYAVSIGAEMPEEQFCQPEWDEQWTTLFDPDGHPFCFFSQDQK